MILTARPPLELSAENEQDMADWMQLICQAVSKGVSLTVALHSTALWPCFLGGLCTAVFLEALLLHKTTLLFKV